MVDRDPPTPKELSEARSARYIDVARSEPTETPWRDLNWRGSLAEYLDLVRADPRLARNAYQRMYDMIVSHGVERPPRGSDRPLHYRFFDDPFGGDDAIFGLDEPLARLVAHLRAGAHGFGAERRVLLLHGPVGSSKSTIARLLKRGLERGSRTSEGAVYSYRWRVEGGIDACPMHEDPLHLIPEAASRRIYADLNARFDGEYELAPSGTLCPLCRWHYERIMKDTGGDFTQIERSIEVYRLVLSEQDRVGVGTFQPKDEKNQDSTELTGDINYRRIAELGSDSDPRAFNFDGEFHVANRGMIEFIEVLKLDVAFLYDLLGASQEHSVKPKKFAQTDIDEVIVGHTNAPEYRRLQNNELMEAFRDRTTKIDIPYITCFSDEIQIYRKTFGMRTRAGRHIAPHAIEAAAMWSVLTRLEDPKNGSLGLMHKLMLYDDRCVPGFTPAVVPELRAEAENEGMFGISPRYVQDRIAAALVDDAKPPCLTGFDVLESLEAGLADHPLVDSEEDVQRYRELASLVRDALEGSIQDEIRSVVASDAEVVGRLCGNYVDAVTAFVTGRGAVDERLMRSVEEKIGVTESRKSDFRREIVNYIEALAERGERFTHESNPRLQAALESKLFEDCRDTFKLSARSSTVIDPDVLEKLEVIRARLVRDHDYCELCSDRVLDHVAGIFARSEAADERGGGER